MKPKRVEDIFELVIAVILITTLVFGLRKSPFNYSFSMIGNWFDHRISFIIWGILTGIFLIIFFVHLFEKTKLKNKNPFGYAFASGIFLILTVITPTKIQEPIEKALREPQLDLHLFWAILFMVFTIATLYTFSNYLSSINKKLSRDSMKLLLTTIIGSIILLTIFGMTGIFEIFFFTTLFIFLAIIDRKITKNLKPKTASKKHAKDIGPRSRSKNNS